MKEWKKDFYDVNLLRPNKGYMGSEVATMLEILLGWGMMTFGFQFAVWLLADCNGKSILTKFSFFNLPFHFWFTGQFLPLWFIILCIVFNFYIDRLTKEHSRRRDRTYE